MNEKEYQKLSIDLRSVATKINTLKEVMQDLPDNMRDIFKIDDISAENIKNINVNPIIQVPQELQHKLKIPDTLTIKNLEGIALKVSNLDQLSNILNAILEKLDKSKKQNKQVVIIENTDEVKQKEVVVKQLTDVIEAIKQIKLNYPKKQIIEQLQKPYKFIINRNIKNQIIQEIKKYKDVTVVTTINRNKDGYITSGNIAIK